MGCSAAYAVLAVTADSPSLATGELDHCSALCREWDVEWLPVDTDELTDERYVANGADRCARCKSALMDAVEPIARRRGAVVVLGVNVDDLGDHRPGQHAVAQRVPVPDGRGRTDQGRCPASPAW